MATPIRVSEELVNEAKKYSRIEHRSRQTKSNIGQELVNVLRKMRDEQVS